MSIYALILDHSSQLRAEKEHAVDLFDLYCELNDQDPWDGWADDMPQMGSAPEPEYTLESESAIDGTDYTGAEGEVPALLGSPVDAWHDNGKRGGHDRKDMLAMDWRYIEQEATLAEELATLREGWADLDPKERRKRIRDAAWKQQRFDKQNFSLFGAGYATDADEPPVSRPLPHKLSPLPGPKVPLKRPALGRKENTPRFIEWLLPRHARSTELAQVRGWLDRKLKAHPDEDDQAVIVSRARQRIHAIDPALDSHLFLTHGVLKKKGTNQLTRTR